MARYLGKWFVTPSTEIIILSFAGIVMTIQEESVQSVPDRLSEVLQFDYKMYGLSPVTLNMVKTCLCLVVLGRSISAPIYLVSYVNVAWVAFFGKHPHLLLPWLLTGFFRHVVLDYISILTSAFLRSQSGLMCCVFQFAVFKFVELALYVYLWNSVLLLYRGLQILEKNTASTKLVQPPSQVDKSAHLPDGLKPTKPCMQHLVDCRSPAQCTTCSGDGETVDDHRQPMCDKSVQVTVRMSSKDLQGRTSKRI